MLDRSKTLPATFAASGPEPGSPARSNPNICVRDVSWNSKVSSAFPMDGLRWLFGANPSLSVCRSLSL